MRYNNKKRDLLSRLLNLIIEVLIFLYAFVLNTIRSAYRRLQRLWYRVSGLDIAIYSYLQHTFQTLAQHV